ncbi:hypothetical protein GY15_02300 [Delftia sp. 670]|nr:hypothetical protein GY15_02300 [Delftia sp. 670]
MIELRLQILQVEGEVQDLRIRGPVGLRIRIAPAAAAGGQDHPARHAHGHAAGLAEELAPVLQLLGTFLQNPDQH